MVRLDEMYKFRQGAKYKWTEMSMIWSVNDHLTNTPRGLSGQAL